MDQTASRYRRRSAWSTAGGMMQQPSYLRSSGSTPISSRKWRREAGPSIGLRLSDVPSPIPSTPLRVETKDDRVTVHTGTVSFTVNRTGPLLEAPGLRDVDLLLRSDERIYKASQWPGSELVVEEQNPLRVVLKRTGAHAWMNREDRALDYVVRIIAYAGRPVIRIVYSFVNRQGREMSDFVRLDGLWLQGQLEQPAAPTKIEQLSSEPRRHRLVRGRRSRLWSAVVLATLSQGIRGPNRRSGPPGALSRNRATPEHLHGSGQDPRADAFVRRRESRCPARSPAVCRRPPKWYTRETRALGRLVESSPEAIRPEYWPLVQRYDRWLAASRDAVLAKRDRGFEFQGRRFDEYGMLNFGDAMHKLITNDRRPDYGIHWETEYYDFPHALFLHFFRTGDMKSFSMAIEAAAHLADVDISHYEVEPGRHGAPRTGPGLNHWTRYSNGVFISSTSWAFYKNEGLLRPLPAHRRSLVAGRGAAIRRFRRYLQWTRPA